MFYLSAIGKRDELSAFMAEFRLCPYAYLAMSPERGLLVGPGLAQAYQGEGQTK